MEAQLRKDVLVNRWVLISPRRGKRPHDYNAANASLKDQAAEHPGPCAFCYNHEEETGPELLAFTNDGCAPNHPCWRVRVVQNKFPAVSPDMDVDIVEDTDDGLPRRNCIMPGFGSHEVVIETPEHDQVFTSLALDQIGEIMRAYRSRIETLREDPRYEYCQIFKNNGNAAGASMVHSHSQIIALPVVPKAAEDEFFGAKAFYDKVDKCVFCEVIQFDIENEDVRLIDQTKHFITIAPFAARFPYETWVLPRRHNSNFGSCTDEEVDGLAAIMKLTLLKMDEGFNYPPFNFMLQTAPLKTPHVPFYHWYIRIVPHLVSIAGFELGSGCHINPVSPEQAAEYLRDMKRPGEDENCNGTRTPEAPQPDHLGRRLSETTQRLIDVAELGQQVKNLHGDFQHIHISDLGRNAHKNPAKLQHMVNL